MKVEVSRLFKSNFLVRFELNMFTKPSSVHSGCESVCLRKGKAVLLTFFVHRKEEYKSFLNVLYLL